MPIGIFCRREGLVRLFDVSLVYISQGGEERGGL